MSDRNPNPWLIQCRARPCDPWVTFRAVDQPHYFLGRAQAEFHASMLGAGYDDEFRVVQANARVGDNDFPGVTHWERIDEA